VNEPPVEPRLRDGLRTCLTTFLGLRIGLIVLAAIAVGVIPARPGVSVPGWPAAALDHGWHAAFTGLVREDALWFLRIATSGYRVTDGSPAFFPLYPLAIRCVSWVVGGHPLLAATLVSNAAFFFGLLVLYDLTVREFSEPVARRTILYLAVFPTAFFYLAPYSESLFLLLSVLAFRQARRDRWVTAAIAGALAAFTRSIGIVLAPALLLMAVERYHANGGRLWPRIAGSLAVALGPITYLALWGILGDDAFAPIRAQEQWHRQIAFPLLSLWRGVEMALGRLGRTDPGYWVIDVLVTGTVIVAIVWGWSRLTPPYLVYALASLLIPLSDPFPDRPLLSMPRFVAVIFPAFWVIADATERRRLPEPLVLATFAAGLGLLSVLFMNWWYIF
jgi:Mannosyltransferase (PIG-V)